jgi:GNAT superfamily N-acetyltransferase
MLTTQTVDTQSKAQVRRFTSLPFRLYKDHPQWVPPLLGDIRLMLNRRKHPFYEHSDADFFLAVRDGRDVGRVAVLENRRYNQYHDKRQAQFYLFDCQDDLDAATALFERAFEWARARGLNQMVGPKGFSALDGYGLLVEGFEHRQMMVMMNYNYPFYATLVEAIGFQKEVDFVSCYLSAESFHLPERIHRIADRIQRRGTLTVQRFSSKRELKAWVNRIGQTYNQAFTQNWEYHPLSEREIAFVVNNLTLVADPRLIKIITHKDDVVGFLFGFPDVSAALQRARGHLFPLGIVHLLREMRRTRWIALNGAGILPEYQGRGGNALLYSEMEKTVRQYHFQHADLTQIAESAVQMRRDLENIGATPYKNHRVYRRDL